MQSVFTWSPFWLLVLLSICGLCCYGIGIGALKIFRVQSRRDERTIPVPAFVGTVATAWALALGFAAADVWSINSAAVETASRERSSLSRLEGMAKPDALDSPSMTQALNAYRLSVSEIEWSGGFNRMPVVEVERALQALRLAIIELARSNVPDPIVSQIVQDFDELQDARNTRLALGSSSINHYKWYLVLCLTLITTVVVASIHADRPRAGRKALIIYCLTAAVSMWILSLHVHPYIGVGHLSSSVLRDRISATQQKAGSDTAAQLRLKAMVNRT